MEEIKVNLENLNKVERENLLALVEKANAPKNKAWKPLIGETYYFLFSEGDVAKDLGGFNPVVQNRYALGNCFRTKEEAQFEANRLKVLAQWKRLSIESGEADNPWDNKHEHYYVFYEYKSGKLLYNNNRITQCTNVHFASEKAIENAIKVVGEENIKRYILGVKE